MKNSLKNYKVHKYSNDLYNGHGEGFILSNKNYAVSLFRFPNTNNLDGVGLHYHPECDDIDIIINGEFSFYNCFDRSIKCSYPALILSKRNTPHGFIANKKSESLIYGFRSPFHGGKPVNKDTKLDNKSFIYELNNYSNGQHNLFETEYTIGYFHKNIAHIPEREIYPKRVIFNIGSELIINKDQISKYNIIEAYCNQRIPLETKTNAIVELIPKFQENI